MVDVLLQIGMAKLLVSMVLACLAWLVQRRVGHPSVAHPLWLLVLIALLLPAVVALPVLPGEGGAAGAVIIGDVGVAGGVAERFVGAATRNDAESVTRLPAWIAEHGRIALATLWLVVAAGLFGWTLVRALRFRHWLMRSSGPASRALLDEVAEIGHCLGLARMPEVHTTTARVSPMVFWSGGRVRLLIPSSLLASLDRHELRAVLAHELAHVRRRDYLVRWIEWLACSAFWWNPVAWWARRESRAAEEASCDALGVTALKCAPRDYAKSLLRAVELLSKPPTPPIPAFASGAANSRSPRALERRIRMLVSGKSTVKAPRWKRVAGATATVCLLPLGLVYCGFADQPLPTALEETAELGTPSEEPAGEQTNKVVFTYDMTGNSTPRLDVLADDAYDVLPICVWIVERDRDGRLQEPRKTSCVNSWHEWRESIKRARAEPDRHITVIHVAPEVAAKRVWRLQESFLANR